MNTPILDWRQLRSAAPFAWARREPPELIADAGGRADVDAALDRWRRCAPLLAALFPKDLPTGHIDSPLVPVPRLAARRAVAGAPPDFARRLFVKADHALPLAGSIKARGGIYAVLCIAERVALEAGLLRAGEDSAVLAAPRARALFAAHRLVVGSTGNLGFAIGLAGRALGFETIVHMSDDAKAWKKARLRALGATVVEHRADYTSAVTAARETAAGAPRTHFIDDERSPDLFYGYSAAARGVADELARRNIGIDAGHPLCVYLPCGVGGAPGGVLYGLRALLGPHVWGFFAEPTASPCVLMRLLGAPASASVYDAGLDNRTIADGLAVARASEFAVEKVGPQILGAYTVTDAEMRRWVAAAHADEGLRLEPSAATALPGPLDRAWTAPAFEPYRARLAQGTHLAWTTGGALLPDQEFEALLA